MYSLRSTRVLIDTEIVKADLVIANQSIADVASYGSVDNVVDVGDRLITPGFVDLHSDAVEKEIEPRPGAHFPIDSAVVELDKKLAACGITTMFHAIAFYEESVVGTRGTEMGADIARHIDSLNEQSLLVDNFAHVRYEATSFGAVSVILDLMQDGVVQFLSFMDHTPGQGQYVSIDNWLKDHKSAFGIGEDEARKVIDIMGEKKALSTEKLILLSRRARQLEIPLASHDDDCIKKIDFMKKLGVTVSEFPTNEEAACYAQEQNLTTGMGAPNVVRGSSQNGNISARQLIKQGLCNFLCSDYHPTSMLQAVYAASREVGIPLGSAFQLVTRNPAEIAGLSDRGKIKIGQRADLLVIEDSFIPTVVLTLKSGLPVYIGRSSFNMLRGYGSSDDEMSHKAVV
jgi:alpha-D-ribose 1-methylphosphonate 5-triphosphate diphosphatase